MQPPLAVSEQRLSGPVRRVALIAHELLTARAHMSVEFRWGRERAITSVRGVRTHERARRVGLSLVLQKRIRMRV